MIRPRLFVFATILFSAIENAPAVDNQAAGNSAAATAAAPVTFDARTAQSGPWSDDATWERGRKPAAGDFVQVRTGHVVTYDVDSPAAIRMIHVAGKLTFSREKSTSLDVGLIRVEPGETTTENGFDCDTTAPAHHGGAAAALEIGTPQSPIPAGVTAVVRLRHFPGTDRELLPAIVVCGGRWDVYGAPLVRTWTRLAAPAKPGDDRVTVEESVADWRAGDRILVATGEAQGPETGHTFHKRPFARQKIVGTEERIVAEVLIDGLRLEKPLARPHRSEGFMHSEVANLSRNTVIESADPAGVRGHTMYHHGSSGGIGYAEFRHLGKDGVLGKYPIHFHLVRDTMRGSGVVGASVWDSHNRWITVHGTDHLLIRDCVGYQSRGHGYFLEDATEQWNVFDRNLAIQSFGSAPLPNQVLPYDPNDGAGFWWANANNTFTRNSTCENDHYGYHFQILKSGSFNPRRRLRGDDGEVAERDIRSIPFLRFEDNESHGDGLFGFRFGDEEHGSVRGTPERPFIARNLRVWDAHYAIRPNVSCFLLEGLRVGNAKFGIYHPDYDAHVYRDVEMHGVTAEPLNGGHDEESIPVGDFTYERLSFVNCRLKRDPLVQLTSIGAKPGLFGHFRDVRLVAGGSPVGQVVDFGGGPRTRRTEPQVAYYFHDTPTAGTVVRVTSAALPQAAGSSGGTPERRKVPGWTGEDAWVESVDAVKFPQLLTPVDKTPPATLITRIAGSGTQQIVSGVAHDNGTVRTVSVNGREARIIAQHAGVADWTVELGVPADGRISAESTDEAGNVERMPHVIGGHAHAHHH